MTDLFYHAMCSIDKMGRKRQNSDAFGIAFGLCHACNDHLVDVEAAHQTPKAAAKAIEKLLKGPGMGEI